MKLKCAMHGAYISVHEIVSFCQLHDKWTLLIGPSRSLKRPTEMKQRLIIDNLQMKTFIIYGTSILNDDQSTL